jgi:hypothetical protein
MDLFDFDDGIKESMSIICRKLLALSDDANIDMQNELKRMLHDVSPLKSEPVDCVVWVKNEDVHAND